MANGNTTCPNCGAPVDMTAKTCPYCSAAITTYKEKQFAKAIPETPRNSSEPQDNLDLDVMDAMRLGYGCRYGHFKADHPYTKDANESRLKPKRKTQEQQQQVRQVYEKVCPVCGRKFITENMHRVYCDDLCKQKKDNKQYRWLYATKGGKND